MNEDRFDILHSMSFGAKRALYEILHLDVDYKDYGFRRDDGMEYRDTREFQVDTLKMFLEQPIRLNKLIDDVTYYVEDIYQLSIISEKTLDYKRTSELHSMFESGVELASCLLMFTWNQDNSHMHSRQ